MKRINKLFDRLKLIIAGNMNFVLTTHVSPDGDAIGSVLSFENYLVNKGKNVRILNHSYTPSTLSFLDRENKIEVFPRRVDSLAPIINSTDVIILLDANEYSRTRSLEEYIRKSSAMKICIDHHTDIKESDFDFVICETSYAANCQLLYDYFMHDNESYINEEVANLLYAGIMTDTGSFRFPRTTSRVLRICADLIDKGADPIFLYEKIYDTMSKSKLNLLQKYLNSFEFHFNDSVVTAIVREKDFGESQAELNDVEGFSAYLMGLENVKMGVLIAELPKGVKVSLRSKGKIPVNELAKEFAGGGHKNAAGISFDKLPVEDIKKDILSKAEKYLI